MDDEGRNASRDRQILSDFIVEYKQLPELWDVRSKEYYTNVIKKMLL